MQWDTSEHDWLEGRGEKLYLIAMIDDATSRLFARFVRHDSTEENMRLLWSYLEKFGRPLAFYTDKASLFQTAEKRNAMSRGWRRTRWRCRRRRSGARLRELGITWIAAHSPQAKGRVERNFGTAQDRLVKGMRVAGVKTIEQANEYLSEGLPGVVGAGVDGGSGQPDDAHRPLEKSHDLAASLSHVETRQVRNDYTLRWDGKLYQIERQAVTSGITRSEGAGGEAAGRIAGGALWRAVFAGERVRRSGEAPKAAARRSRRRRHRAGRRGSDWNKNFDLKKAPKIWQAAQASGYRQGEAG